MRNKADLIAGVFIILIGVVFLIESNPFGESDSETMGAMLLPRTIAIMLVLLGGVLAARPMMNPQESSTIDFSFLKNKRLLGKLLFLAISGFVYLLLFQMLGYLLASIIIAVPVFYIFENRGMKALIGLPVITVSLIYYLFFITMGLYQAPATVFSLF